MSFEKIEAAIVKEAEADVKTMLQDVRRVSDEALALAREESEREFEEAIRQAEAAAARETSRQVGLARHGGRLRVLEGKNRVIDEVFKQAAERIVSLPEQEYLHLMSDWLKAIPAEAGGVLMTSSRDTKRFSKDFLEKINKDRPRSGWFTAVEADPQITGGFIVIGENFTMDSTITNKTVELRESLAGDMAKELFGS